MLLAFYMYFGLLKLILPSTLQKNTSGALMVLKQMELADVKPDSKTFSYLISNCECEEDIIKVPQSSSNFISNFYM